MKLSLQSDYSLRILMFAAIHSPARITVDQVALANGISRNHLVKIVHKLGKAGYLHTHKGRGGGFTLAHAPVTISLADIIRIGEQDDRVITCIDHGAACRLLPDCRLRGVLDRAADAFFAVLGQHTLQDLVAQPSSLYSLLERTGPAS